jgi:Flp pilus assembly protein TadD
MTPPRPLRGRVLGLAVIVLALAGVVVILAGDDLRSAPSPAAATDPAAAHAAAGVVTGPQVGAAFDQRVRDLRWRVAAEPNDRILVLELARLLHDGHRTREAVPMYRRAVVLDPSDPVAQYDLAAAHGELGEWELAREVLRKRVEAAPTDAIALYDLGVVEANLDDPAEARVWLERARSAAGADADLRARIEDALARLGAGPDPGPPRGP